ncbi:MAG: sigma-70 family RNA polymerase sigma factor [Spirochaetes bacterium]|nr:sigma-70 family RNA polymerase sigma factor [Spirochaetota bacterium]
MSFAKRGANTQNEKNLADRIKLLGAPEIEKLIMDNYAENISGSIMSFLETNSVDPFHHERIFQNVIAEISKNGFRFVKKYNGEYSFEIYLSALSREKTYEYLYKNKLIKKSGNSHVNYADYSKAVYPDMEFLSLERRELFVSACDIVADWKKSLKPEESAVYVMRVKEKMSFKEINSLLKISDSSKLFGKIMKEMKDDIMPRILKAIDSYYGVY